MSVKCDYCHRQAKLVSGSTIYPHRADLFDKFFWHCDPCGAWVGCHPRNRKRGQDGTEPLGRLANAQLRKAKQEAHAAFDPLWKSGDMTRTEAYTWLAGALGISAANTHIGMMDVDGCNAVVAACMGRNRA